jgi:formylglycine-generating enzyme required for sulfatase activity
MKLLRWLVGGALLSFSLFALSLHFGKVEVNLNFGGTPWRPLSTPSDQKSQKGEVPPAAPSRPQLSDAAHEWSRVDKASIAELEVFIRWFGDTYYGDLAKRQLDELKRAAEQQRLAVLQQQQADKARKKAEADALARQRAEEAARREPEAEVGRRGPQVGQTFRDCNDCPPMVVVPAGELTQWTGRHRGGRPEERKTNVGQMAIGKYEVTVDEFEAFVNATNYKVGEKCNMLIKDEWKERAGSFRRPGFRQTGKHPAACVGWDDAKAYTVWLSHQTGKIYRLPTVIEWMYATQRTSFVETGAGAQGTHPVDEGKPNGFGIHGMYGNVWVWLEDCGSNESITDCRNHYTMGIGWEGRSGKTSLTVPDDRRSNNLGFRLAREMAP